MSDAVWVELIHLIPAIIGTLAVAFLTIRNGMKTDRVINQVNGSLANLEANRVTESNRLLDSAVGAAQTEANVQMQAMQREIDRLTTQVRGQDSEPTG